MPTAPRGSENGNRYSPSGLEVLTGVTRTMIDVTAPRADQIDLRDIARSLARQERFTGHCPLRPTVAEHSVAAMLLAVELLLRQQETSSRELVSRRALAAVLLHDAAEYLVSDLNGGVKMALRNAEGNPLSAFDLLEADAAAAIAKRFGLKVGAHGELVHEADILACAYEMAWLGWCPDAKPPEWVAPVVRDRYGKWDGGEQAFLKCAAELGLS